MALKLLTLISLAAMVVALLMGDVWLYEAITTFPVTFAAPPPPVAESIALAASIFCYGVAKTLSWYQSRGTWNPRTWGE